MRIQNNIIADNSHRQLNFNTSNTGKNVEKLSSGLRVNRAADDAAGLAISEKMRTQIRGLNRASLNIQDGISLLQVGDGAMQFLHNIMQRLRELSVQSANDTNQELDRNAIQLEFGQLITEINDVVSTTNFNGRFLFNGDIGASYEYNLGQKTVPYTTSIPAGGDFTTPLPVPGWNANSLGFGRFAIPATVTSSIFNGAPFPTTGLFAMQLVTPANGTFNVIADFATDNITTITEFEDFFTNQFNLLSRAETGEDIVDRVRFDPSFPGLVFDFPKDGNTLTGVMGRPSTPGMPAFETMPWAFFGIGSGSGTFATEMRETLNGNASNAPWTTSNIKTNRSDLEGTINASTVFANTAILGIAAAPFPDPAGLEVGVYPSVTITVDGTPSTLNLVPGNYTDIESFVDANRRAFETAMPRGFNLDIDESGRLLITTTSKDGTTPPVTITTNPGTLRAALGFGTLGDVSTEQDPGKSLWIQSGANEGDGIRIGIPRLCTRSLGLSIRRPEDTRDPADGGSEHINSLGAGGYAEIANVAGDPMEYSLDVTSHEKAGAAITVLSNAINIISIERAQIGAQQNRLEYAMAGVDNTSENLQAAESRIRDADMAYEMTVLVKNQILTQASTAMLAQSNTLPQGVLQLLG